MTLWYISLTGTTSEGVVVQLCTALALCFCEALLIMELDGNFAIFRK